MRNHIQNNLVVLWELTRDQRQIDKCCPGAYVWLEEQATWDMAHKVIAIVLQWTSVGSTVAHQI